MKTRVITLKRDNKEICLVGAQHIATSDYYDKIQNVLDSFEPSDVFYEMMESETGKDGNKELDLLFENILKITSLTYQTDYIKYNDKWTKSDISLELFESFLGGHMDDKMNKSDKIKIFNKQVEKTNKKILKTILIFTFKHLNVIKKFIKDDKVTLDIRNNNLLLDMFEHLILSDKICVFYGDAHFDKITVFLKSVGFNIIEKKYLNPFE